MLTTLMMLAKVATQGLLKINIFFNKGYGVINSVYDVINKNVSPESNFIVGVIMWPRFGNSSTSMSEVHVNPIL